MLRRNLIAASAALLASLALVLTSSTAYLADTISSTANLTAAQIGPQPFFVAWGDNTYGQLGDETTTEQDVPEQVPLPDGVTFTQVSAGGYHNLALGSDGDVYAWGANTNGQLGDGTTTGSDLPIPITLATGVTATQVAAGQTHSLALGSDGNVYAWGANTYGQLGTGDTTDRYTPVAITNSWSPAQIAAGRFHSVLRGAGGGLYTWGRNIMGQLGTGDTTEWHTPVVITLASGVAATSVSAHSAGNYCLVIGSDNQLYGWGNDSFGNLGIGADLGADNQSGANQLSPIVITLASGVTARAVAIGGGHSLAIGSDGKLYAWGYNSSGQLGDGTTTNQNTPVAITLPSGVTPASITGGAYHSLMIGSDHLVYTWGQNTTGQLGDGSTTNRTTPSPIAMPYDVTVSLVVGGDGHTIALVGPPPVPPSPG